MGPRGVLRLHSLSSNSEEELVINHDDTTALLSEVEMPLPLSALQLRCSVGERPELRSFWMSVAPARACKSRSVRAAQ
ncbi:hypothetical protein CesoFtcFv8_009860 [Champsocephalus esox]|uniref:Uncharacterized protein n=1 Tax=Champsocephalus esox TaxID=159716 RepID=A0AAN8C3A8_9TELE|nr:hypothetical protein CesoFtcFv8_009860 [Champsocephalus esox]